LINKIETIEVSDDESEQRPIEMKVPIADFVHITDRKNLIIELDKVLLDFCTEEMYKSVLIDQRTKQII